MSRDLRRHQRKPFDRRAWVQPAEGAETKECKLVNLSESGAKLIFKEETELPVNFILLLSDDGRVARKCRLAWHSGNEVGVEFVARLVSA